MYQFVIIELNLKCREYYGDSDNKQCQLCHPLCDAGCAEEVCKSLFIKLSLHLFVCSQGPTNCVMCTNSSLFVNRSNVIECVNRTCPVGWYDDGMNRECTYCDCVCNVNSPCAQVNVNHVLKDVAH